MLLLFAFPWMAGTWYPSDITPVLKDINGVPVNVGDTVFIPCTVTALQPATAFLGQAQLQVTYGPGQNLTVSTLNLTH